MIKSYERLKKLNKEKLRIPRTVQDTIPVDTIYKDGIFKSGNPKKRADAIVKAVTNYKDAKMLAELSSDLGEAMVGINESEIQLLMAERGK